MIETQLALHDYTKSVKYLHARCFFLSFDIYTEPVILFCALSCGLGTVGQVVLEERGARGERTR